MAVFTSTPIDIAPNDPFLRLNDGDTGGAFCGPWYYNGNVYIVGARKPSRQAAVAKSTDGGATWSQFFQAGSETWNPGAHAVLDPANDKIVFAANDQNTGDLFTFEFDLSGETFSSNTDSGILISNDISVVIRANGEIVCLYSLVTGPPRPLEGVVISGNAFGTPFTVDAGSGLERLRPRAVVVDPNTSVIHIAYDDTVVTSDLLYNTLDPSNTPGMRATIGAYGSVSSNGIISQTFDQIIFTDSSTGSVDQAFIGTPISGPTWTTVPLHGSTPGIVDDEAYVIDSGATVNFLYSHRNSGPQTLLEIMEVDWDGSTMGSPVVYWDIIANPPTGAIGVAASDMETLGISADNRTGSLGVAVTTVINTGLDLSSVWVSMTTPSGPAYRNRFY